MHVATTRRELLANKRRAAGLTQAEIASRVGITQQHYSLIENGQRDPALRVVLRIAEVLDADPRELFADVLDEQAATAESA